MIMQELSSVNMQQIEIFLSIAETHSFTQTAHIFNMTQSGISKNMSKLEDTLGLCLFVRNNKYVTLTSSGQVLYQEWRDGLNAIEVAYKNAKLMDITHPGDLHLGIQFSIDSTKALSRCLEVWKERCPNSTIHIIEDSMYALESRLSLNKLDIIVIPIPEQNNLNPHTSHWRPMAYDAMQILVDGDHPLASRPSVSVEDIVKYPHILHAPTVNYNEKKFLEEFLQPYETQLSIEGCAKSSYEIHTLLEGTQRILFINSFFHYAFEGDGCVKIPVEGCQSSVLCAWNKKIRSDSVIKFLSLIDEICPETE